MYFEDLISANRFTRSIGLPGAEIAPAGTRRHLHNPKFFPEIGRYIQIDEPQELVAKCNIVSQVICEVLREMGCGAYLTIGEVTISGERFFNIDEEYVTGLVAGGKRSLRATKYHHHAWITLDSMEIVDFTINTSIALLSRVLDAETRTKMLGGVLAGHGDELRNEIRYHPVLIGEEFYVEYDAVYPMLKEMYVRLLGTKSGQTLFAPIVHDR